MTADSAGFWVVASFENRVAWDVLKWVFLDTSCRGVKLKLDFATDILSVAAHLC
jgi:hypothetical protein